MNYILAATIAINSLAFTVPLLVRCSFLLGDWIDGKMEDSQRGKA
jgi:hypothetical protein